MARIKARPPSDKRTKKWTFEYDGFDYQANPRDKKQMIQVAQETGSDVADLLAAVDSYTEPASESPDGVFTIKAWGGDGGIFEISETDPIRALDRVIHENSGSGVEFSRWEDIDRLCALDVDVTHPLRPGDLLMALSRTGADRGWLTKSSGIRLMFGPAFGLTALERAMLGVHLGGGLDSPHIHEIEVKRDTRLPTSYPQAGIGDPDPESLIRKAQLGFPKDGAVVEWLETNGMEIGKRYEHIYCPINPSTGPKRQPVVCFEDGVYCYVCGKDGSGQRSFAMLTGEREEGEIPQSILMAQNWVHWTHARIVLNWTGLDNRVARQVCGYDTVRVFYGALLKACHVKEFEEDPDEFEKKVKRTLQKDRRLFIRTEDNVWVSSKTFNAYKTDAPTLRGLPWTHGDPDRVTEALNAVPLEGYPPVRPLSSLLRPDALPKGVAPVLVESRFPCKVPLDDPMPWDQAFDAVRQILPGINELYLKTCLMSILCSEPGGAPIMIFAHGGTGTAKSRVPLVAAAMVSARAADLSAQFKKDDWDRALGEALASGARPIMVNELDKLVGLWSHRSKLLTLESTHDFRALYVGNRSVSVRAPLILTGLSLPPAFYTPELGRRTRVIELLDKVPPWYGAPIETWRDNARRAEVADSLVTHCYREAERDRFVWFDVANRLGLPQSDRLDSDINDRRRDIIRTLYRCLVAPPKPNETTGWELYPTELGFKDMFGPIKSVWSELLPDSKNPEWVLNSELSSRDWTDVGSRGDRFEGHFRDGGTRWVARIRPLPPTTP